MATISKVGLIDLSFPEQRELAEFPPLNATAGPKKPEMRSTGASALTVFCKDYRCSHNVRWPAAEVDKWQDQVRLSDLEPRFVCRVCGKRGAIIRSEDPPV